MPRIALTPEKKEEYMIDNLPYFFANEAKKRGFNQKDLASAIGITPQAYSARKKHKKDKSNSEKQKDTFTYGEILKILRLFDLPKEDKLLILSKIFIY